MIWNIEIYSAVVTSKVPNSRSYVFDTYFLSLAIKCLSTIFLKSIILVEETLVEITE